MIQMNRMFTELSESSLIATWYFLLEKFDEIFFASCVNPWPRPLAANHWPESPAMNHWPESDVRPRRRVDHWTRSDQPTKRTPANDLNHDRDPDH